MNDWLMRAIAVMTSGSESPEEVSTRLRKAEAENANGHRVLRQYAQNSRNARKGKSSKNVASHEAISQELEVQTFNDSRVARVLQKKADIKADALAKKSDIKADALAKRAVSLSPSF